MIILFLEDDYVHKPDSDKLIVDGLKIFDYVICMIIQINM